MLKQYWVYKRLASSLRRVTDKGYEDRTLICLGRNWLRHVPRVSRSVGRKHAPSTSLSGNGICTPIPSHTRQLIPIPIFRTFYSHRHSSLNVGSHSLPFLSRKKTDFYLWSSYKVPHRTSQLHITIQKDNWYEAMGVSERDTDILWSARSQTFNRSKY